MKHASETPENQAEFMRLVLEESSSAARAHDPYHSAHEAYGVLLEEVDEFWEEVRKKREQRDKCRMLTELVQIASVCMRTAQILGCMITPLVEDDS